MKKIWKVWAGAGAVMVGRGGNDRQGQIILGRFHWSLIENNEIIEIWIFFYKCIRIGQAGWQNNEPTSSTFLRVIERSKTNLHTKFQPNWTIFVEVIHLYRFLAGRLVGLVHIIRFQKNFSLESEWMLYKHTQKIKLISQGVQKLSHFEFFF